MDKNEIIATVARLRSTYGSGRTQPLDWRIEQLRHLRDLMTEREGELLDALQADLGKPRLEGVISETHFIVSEIDHTIKHLRAWAKPEKVSVPMVNQPGSARIIREPLGLVLNIAPWNYPLQLALSPAIGALAAGNCVVIKPSEATEAVSAALARLLPEYMDSDAIALIEGAVDETTVLLEQRFDHIFYTGGGAVGKIVMAAAAAQLCPVTLELGGKSPCIVDRSVDLNAAAHRIVWAKFFNTGQTCVAPDYVLAHEAIHDELLQRMKEVVLRFYGDDPSRSTSYGRIVNERHHRRLAPLLADGELVVGGQSDEAERYIAPTILKNIHAEDPIMQSEIFGPILPVLKVDSLDEVVRFVNEREKPLALYIFTKDAAVADSLLSRTTSGGACVNDCILHLTVPGLPFGGVGPSGMGSYHGKAGFDTFSNLKSVLDHGTLVDPPLRYPPYSEAKVKWARRLM